MKNIFKITLFTAALSITASCDNYVDIDPKYTLDAENYFRTPSDYDRALIGAYDLLQTSYLSFWIGEIASDNSIAGGESPTDTEGLHQIDEMTHGGVNNELRSIWRWMYAGITRANYIFEFKDNIEFEGKNQILAQAAFLRAYYYSELVKFFGDVPLIVDRRLGIDEASSIGRTPKEEVYAQIEDDLEFAAANLEWTAVEKGRITKGAALSLLGKIFLYQNKFTEAAQTLQTVIDEGPYDLAPLDGIFGLENEDNTESVFAIEFVGVEGGSYGCFVCLEGNAAVGFGGIRNYKGPVYSDGNSYNLPTEDLYNAFENGDPRRELSILDIEAFKEEVLADDPDAEFEYVEGAGGHTGYYNNKYIKKVSELGLPDTDLTSPLNYFVIRYADVLLMAAEANARKSPADETLARQYLNEVRDRAGLDDIGASGQALIDAIWAERRLELAGEGHRFFDLVRTGQAEDVIEGFVPGRHELFPLSQDEIDLTGAGWSQNPNYN